MISGWSSKVSQYDASLESAYRANCILKGDISTNVVLHVDDRCATTLRVTVYFPLSFPTFLSSIRWLLTIKKLILLSRGSLIQLFSLKNNALFKKAETPSQTRLRVQFDLISGSF